MRAALKLGIDNSIHLWPFDKNKNLFDQIKLPPENTKVISINRMKLGNRPHRSYTRDSFYADHYLPLLLRKEGGETFIKVGFDWENSVDLNDTNRAIILTCLQFAKNEDIAKFYVNEDDEVKENINSLCEFLENQFGKSKPFYYISWNKQRIHQYFIENFSNAQFVKRLSNDIWWDNVTQFFMEKLHYRTERKEVIEKDNNYKNSLDKLKRIKK